MRTAKARCAWIALLGALAAGCVGGTGPAAPARPGRPDQPFSLRPAEPRAGREARIPVGFFEPEFSLIDTNPNSATSGRRVTPRQHLGHVSAWYFGHST